MRGIVYVINVALLSHLILFVTLLDMFFKLA